MRNLAGSAVWGEDFRFRERELAFARQAVVDGNSILVLGLRRIGKSSFLIELEGRLRESGAAVPCRIDVQDRRTAQSFWDMILRALPDEVVGRFHASLAKSRTVPARLAETLRRAFKKAEGAGIGLEMSDSIVEYWRPISDTLERVLVEADERIVILIDEFPFFIENLLENGYTKAAISEVLATLRSWRNRQIPLVIAGSISIDALLEIEGFSGVLFNNIARVQLKPLADEQAVSLLSELVASSNLTTWTDDTVRSVLSRIDDKFPYFIQSAFQHLRVEDASDEAYLERVFRSEIEPDWRRAFFSQFDERLEKRFPGPLRRLAATVLDRIAVSDDGRISLAEVKEICRDLDDVSILIRRLEMSEFVEESADRAHLQFAFRFLKTWRLSRGAAS